MADDLKKLMHKRVGVGGLKCFCCNQYKGRGRKALVRIVRRTSKKEIAKIILSEISDTEI